MAVTSYTPEQSANAKALHEKVERVFKDRAATSSRSALRRRRVVVRCIRSFGLVLAIANK